MNIITFDIEEWSIVKERGVTDAAVYAEYDRYLDQILDALDVRGFKGTFFCTGRMAEEFPQVVKRIDGRGHEIGCHSYQHTWMNKMSEEEAQEDTHRAVEALEQCIGKKVLSYRAPAFSIGERNLWMFDILAECGIERDASIYPASRDFGGFPNFGQKVPCTIEHNGIQLKEFPVCTAKFFGKEMAYSGGGYFRFFPLWFIKQQMHNVLPEVEISVGASYTMCYFHIDDLTQKKGGVPTKERFETYYKQPGTLKNRYIRYIKTNLGKKGAMNKMLNLIASEEFKNINQVNAKIDWEAVSVVRI